MVRRRSRADTAKRRRRLPRQIPPRRIEEDYAKALVKIVRRARHAWAPVIDALPEIVRQDAWREAAQGGEGLRRWDANSKRLSQLINKAVASARRVISTDELNALARKIADRTSGYQKDQLTRQVKAALGVDPLFRDKKLAARAEAFTHENVALVKRIPERLHGDLETMITRAVSRGQLKDDLTQDIADRFDVTERHARLIARDQIAKYYADLNHSRQQEMGVSRFIWRTVGDERVRGTPGGKWEKALPSHYDLDGKTFSYDDPPQPEGADEPLLPGWDYQCRCWSEPVFDDLDAEDVDTEEPESDEQGT